MSSTPLISGKVFYSLLVACLLLLAIDLVYHRHVVHAFESWFGFYGFYGFVACVALVLAARVMRTWLMRREDYYDVR